MGVLLLMADIPLRTMDYEYDILTMYVRWEEEEQEEYIITT